MITIRHLDHLVLRVVDLPRMRAFYCNVLDCSVAREQHDIGLTQLRAGASMIDLVTVSGTLGRAGGAAPAVGGRNLDHFCLRIDWVDEASLRAHLSHHGVTASATELRYGAEGEGVSLYLTDPEGNVVELKGDVSPRP